MDEELKKLVKTKLLTMKIRIGIVGSREYKNKEKVKKVLQAAIRKFSKDDIMVISGGAIGADTLGRECALELDLDFVEFNPAHTLPNEYSGMRDEYYQKPYNVGNYFERNSLIAEFSDRLFAFIPDGITCNGTMNTYRKAKKLNKKVTILN